MKPARSGLITPIQPNAHAATGARSIRHARGFEQRIVSRTEGDIPCCVPETGMVPILGVAPSWRIETAPSGTEYPGGLANQPDLSRGQQSVETQVAHGGDRAAVAHVLAEILEPAPVRQQRCFRLDD